MAAASTIRWREWHKRELAGITLTTVSLTHPMIEAMIDSGLISERDSADKAALGRAIRLFLANALGHSANDAGDDSGNTKPKGRNHA